MSEEEQINPGHRTAKRILRVAGPLTVAVGLLLTLIGIGSFFASFGSFAPPRYFWCAFLGIPLTGIGLMMSQFGFLGAIIRYQAGEVAPVGKDTFNYFADGTRTGVRTIATAAGAGLAEALRDDAVRRRCGQCGHGVDDDARFCDGCGASLAVACAACGASNDPDAAFCDQCGGALVR